MCTDVRVHPGGQACGWSELSGLGHIEWEMPAVPQMVCSQEAARLEVTVWEASLEVALKAEGMDEKGPG